jgi:hypothetical protein
MPEILDEPQDRPLNGFEKLREAASLLARRAGTSFIGKSGRGGAHCPTRGYRADIARQGYTM